MSKENEQLLISKNLNENNFDDLDINNQIKSALKVMKMVKMTPIQATCIPHLMEGKDVIGAAKTGSGKTLAFLIPLVNKIMNSDFEPRHGTAAIVISPTRELSEQTFQVLNKLVANTNLKTCLLIGGNNRNIEARNLKNGVTIIVATPGRLLDHLNNTEFFLVHRLQTLVIDEADKLMEQGFLDDMIAIVKKLPKKRQGVLFSATLKADSEKLLNKKKDQMDKINKKTSLDEKVLTLARLIMKKDCMCFDMSKVDLINSENVSNNGENATNSQLNQGYVICKESDKFRLLYRFIRKYSKKKIMVFMSTCLEVMFYHAVLNRMSVPATILALHGKLNQAKRLSNFDEFKEKESAIILCTDIAARGLDVPHVDWVIQYDPPNDPKEYIHRVGRTARAGAAGQAVIFLRPQESGFVDLLYKHRVPMDKLECDEADLTPIQDWFEKFVESNKPLQSSAEAAFSSLIKAYCSFSAKCFDLNKLELRALAGTFGLREPPRVMIDVSLKSRNKSSKKRGADSNGDYSSAPSKVPRKH